MARNTDPLCHIRRKLATLEQIHEASNNPTREEVEMCVNSDRRCPRERKHSEACGVCGSNSDGKPTSGRECGWGLCAKCREIRYGGAVDFKAPVISGASWGVEWDKEAGEPAPTAPIDSLGVAIRPGDTLRSIGLIQRTATFLGPSREGGWFTLMEMDGTYTKIGRTADDLRKG